MRFQIVLCIFLATVAALVKQDFTSVNENVTASQDGLVALTYNLDSKEEKSILSGSILIMYLTGKTLFPLIIEKCKIRQIRVPLPQVLSLQNSTTTPLPPNTPTLLSCINPISIINNLYKKWTNKSSSQINTTTSLPPSTEQERWKWITYFKRLFNYSNKESPSENYTTTPISGTTEIPIAETTEIPIPEVTKIPVNRNTTIPLSPTTEQEGWGFMKFFKRFMAYFKRLFYFTNSNSRKNE